MSHSSPLLKRQPKRNRSRIFFGCDYFLYSFSPQHPLRRVASWVVNAFLFASVSQIIIKWTLHNWVRNRAISSSILFSVNLHCHEFVFAAMLVVCTPSRSFQWGAHMHAVLRTVSASVLYAHVSSCAYKKNYPGSCFSRHSLEPILQLYKTHHPRFQPVHGRPLPATSPLPLANFCHSLPSSTASHHRLSALHITWPGPFFSLDAPVCSLTDLLMLLLSFFVPLHAWFLTSVVSLSLSKFLQCMLELANWNS